MMRLVQQPGAGGGLPTYFIRELAFEVVRLRDFPKLPSRFNSIFVFEDRNVSIREAQSDGKRDIAYRVELVTPDAKSHRAGHNLIIWPQPGVLVLQWFEDLAKKYWAGQEIQTAEVVTESAVRVLERIS
jgi:hypothetical protein